MKVYVGRLVTVNQEEYPGLGAYFIQLRDEDDDDEIVIARIYGDSFQEVTARAQHIADRINGLGD